MALHPRSQSHRFWTAPKSTATTQRATVFVSVALLLFLTITPAVLARYKPPKPSRPSGTTIGTVVRGEGSCEAKPTGSLTALAPLSHIGQTTATRPTFAWYVPDQQSYPIEFRLYAYSNKRDYIVEQRQSTQGVMQYTLPKKYAALTPGQTYLWQVALRCDLGDDSKDKVVRTEVEVVAMPATLQASLAKTADRLQRANLYAEAGFWYDAFAEALAVGSKTADSKAKSFMIPLLEDLVDVEETGTSKEVKQQHNQLRQIVEIERQ